MVKPPRMRITDYLAAALPIGASLLLLWPMFFPLPKPSPYRPVALMPVYSASARALESLFREMAYRWPPSQPVPRIGLQSLPPNMRAIPDSQRKRLFLRSVLPLIIAVNNRMRNDRMLIRLAYQKKIWRQSKPGSLKAQLVAITRRFRIASSFSSRKTWVRLLRRVDIVPAGLVLAQAAKESGWGTSDFALAGNNLFGIWTWRQTDGLIPADRSRDRRYRIRVYPDLLASVRDYIYNLNVGRAYAAFRAKRAALRASGEALNPIILAKTLNRYSQRGKIYTRRLSKVIEENQLATLGPLRLFTEDQTPSD